jgi:hypothetical protein
MNELPFDYVCFVRRVLIKSLGALLSVAFAVPPVSAARLTLTRYMARGIHRVAVLALRDAHTGFGRNAVITDGMPALEVDRSRSRRSPVTEQAAGRLP